MNKHTLYKNIITIVDNMLPAVDKDRIHAVYEFANKFGLLGDNQVPSHYLPVSDAFSVPVKLVPVAPEDSPYLAMGIADANYRFESGECDGDSALIFLVQYVIRDIVGKNTKRFREAQRAVVLQVMYRLLIGVKSDLGYEDTIAKMVELYNLRYDKIDITGTERNKSYMSVCHNLLRPEIDLCTTRKTAYREAAALISAIVLYLSLEDLTFEAKLYRAARLIDIKVLRTYFRSIHLATEKRKVHGAYLNSRDVYDVISTVIDTKLPNEIDNLNALLQKV